MILKLMQRRNERGLLNLSRHPQVSTPVSGFNTLPEKPGVYVLRNSEDRPIYVGKASSIRARVLAHLRPKYDEPIPQTLKEQITSGDYILTQSAIEALILENVLIKKYKPRYNIRLKDDKSYPFIKVTVSEVVPRVLVTRRVENDNAHYFGPYGNARAARRTVKYLRKIFPIRGCSLPLDGVKKFKSCIDYSIGLCKAPCIFAVSNHEYNQDVKKFEMFLEGRLVQLSKVMYDEMWKSSEKQDFERASKLRDEIRSLETTALRQRISFREKTRDKDVLTISRQDRAAVAMVFQVREGNVVGSEKYLLEGQDETTKDSEILSAFVRQYYTSNETRKARGLPPEIVLPLRLDDAPEVESLLNAETMYKVRLSSVVDSPENEKLAKLAQENADSLLKESESKDEARKRERLRGLKDLKEFLGLQKIPRRIECFDISNIQGDEAVGAMTVFIDGFPDKSQYRKFGIRSVSGIDDYSMMAEMISRRFKHLSEARFAREEPDLVIIDGGRGHLNAALDQMRRDNILGIPTVALAKKEELVFLPRRRMPLRLSRDSESLHILQHVRDQAHRFGVTYHRKLRSKKITGSVLDKVPGIGEKRKRNLLAHFGSIQAIKRSSIDEISQVGKVNKKLATAILTVLSE